MELIVVASMLLAVAWPAFAVGAAIIMIVAVVALRRDRIRRDRLRAMTRAGSLLSIGAGLTAFAAYGYGLMTSTMTLMSDKDDACATSRSGASPAAGGSESL